ncbi:MAG TPA: DNA ligase (NAD(+)) LigA, partial [Chitinophagales bacterium]|nr:DNA ligase (NAD(+)) LigA [Chitinophagales bacterium]
MDLFSSTQQHEYIALTESLLKKSEDFIPEQEAEKVLDDLKKVINFHDKQYYTEAKPIISDYDYDRLFKKLKELEAAYPQLLTADSPTQRVAKGLNAEFPTVQHLVPMMSLENSYNLTDLEDFDRRVHDALPSTAQPEYVVELKFDGSSIALVYENDILVRAATRGNGVEGDEITQNAKAIRSIPLQAKFSQYGI